MKGFAGEYYMSQKVLEIRKCTLFTKQNKTDKHISLQ